jgi:dephospho-CoA kinase
MEFWIVTGGAASGKSQFCEILERLEPGVKVFSADALVRSQLSEPEMAAKISASLGTQVLAADQTIDRGKLRGLVFEDEDARRKLEALLHPLVYARLSAELEEARANRVNLFLAEVPLFFESGGGLKPDRTLLIAAQVRFQAHRIVDKRGLTDVAAARIIQAQWPLEDKIRLADVVVWNEGGIRLLEMQAEHLLQQLHQNHVH